MVNLGAGAGVDAEAGLRQSLAVFLIKKTARGIRISHVGRCCYCPGRIYENEVGGVIMLEGDKVPKIEPKFIENFNPRNISPSSCVVLLDDDCNKTRFAKAVIVDDIWELMAHAEILSNKFNDFDEYTGRYLK